MSHELLVSLGQKPRKGDVTKCSICAKEFYRQPAYIQQGRHLCSLACNKAWQARRQRTVACEVCGRELTLAVSGASRRRYCSLACRDTARTTHSTGRFHNGRPVIQDKDGYLWLFEPGHPNANRAGRIREHRYVMSQVLGRPLERYEHVDHKNEDKTDNSPENLQLLDGSTHGKKTNEDQRRKREAQLRRLAELEAEVARLREALEQ